MHIPANTALLIVDVQEAIDDPVWSREGPRNNLDAERNIVRLLERWRSSARPIFHIRHDSIKPISPYRPDQPGNAFKPEARPADGEPIIRKTTNNVFIGTDLEQRLRSAGITTLGDCRGHHEQFGGSDRPDGWQSGFQRVGDAAFTFARRDYRGILRSAEEVHAMSLANMNGEYCKVVTTEELLLA